MTSPIAALDRSLGRCPRCMRKSFLAALAAWLLALAAATLAVPSALVLGIAAGAIGLSVLWIAHVLSFALRSAATAGKAPGGEGRPTGHDGSAAAARTRREVMFEFARAAAFAALATALSAKAALACVQVPKSCSANSDCDCSKCCGQFGNGGICQPSC